MNLHLVLFHLFFQNESQTFSGNAFGIDFGLYCGELLENLKDDSESAKNEETSSKFEVLFSPGLLTHMKKVLKKDPESMSVLNTINRVKKSGRQSMVTASPPPTTPQIKKGPTDYPMPPSPESNSPSDTSDKGKIFTNSILLV